MEITIVCFKEGFPALFAIFLDTFSDLWNIQISDCKKFNIDKEMLGVVEYNNTGKNISRQEKEEISGKNV